MIATSFSTTFWGACREVGGGVLALLALGALVAVGVWLSERAGRRAARRTSVGGAAKQQRGSYLEQAAPPAIRNLPAGRPVRMSRPTSTGLRREDER